MTDIPKLSIDYLPSLSKLGQVVPVPLNQIVSAPEAFIGAARLEDGRFLVFMNTDVSGQNGVVSAMNNITLALQSINSKAISSGVIVVNKVGGMNLMDLLVGAFQSSDLVNVVADQLVAIGGKGHLITTIHPNFITSLMDKQMLNNGPQYTNAARVREQNKKPDKGEVPLPTGTTTICTTDKVMRVLEAIIDHKAIEP